MAKVSAVNVNVDEYAIVCQEHSKVSSEVMAYKIDTEPTPQNLVCLELRSRFNPELKYYLTRKENVDACIQALSSDFKSELTIGNGIMALIG